MCCHRSPLRLRGGPASSHEPVDPAVVFDLSVDRLSRFLSLGVQLPAVVGGQSLAHAARKGRCPMFVDPAAHADAGETEVPREAAV